MLRKTALHLCRCTRSVDDTDDDDDCYEDDPDEDEREPTLLLNRLSAGLVPSDHDADKMV